MLKTVSIVIPAHNEGENIGSVLKELLDTSLEIIVVADACSDNTIEVVKSFSKDIIIVDLPMKNGRSNGKAAAMYEGLKKSTGDAVAFVDADLRGLEFAHIDDLTGPVIVGFCKIAIAQLRSWRLKDLQVTLSQMLFPYIGGQQAAMRETWFEIFGEIPDLSKVRFKIEREIKRIAQDKDLRYNFVIWHGVSQVMKEQKLGFRRGLISRFQMYKEMLRP